MRDSMGCGICYRHLTTSNLLLNWHFSRNCIHFLWDAFSVGYLFCPAVEFGSEL